MSTPPSKRCGGCGLTLSLGAFNKNRHARDGLQSRCKACQARWYAQHRDAQLARMRARHRRIREHHDHLVQLVNRLATHPLKETET